MDEKQIIFVLGCPGAGKGTQCALIVKELGLGYCCAGDLLREERMKADSKFAKLIEEKINLGQIVPSSITVSLLVNSIKSAKSSKCIVDGFPRSRENYDEWVNQTKDLGWKMLFVLYLDCREETMIERIKERSKVSGRSDDTLEILQKRYHTFVSQTEPICQYFQGLGLLRRIKEGTVETVHDEIKTLLQKH